MKLNPERVDIPEARDRFARKYLWAKLHLPLVYRMPGFCGPRAALRKQLVTRLRRWKLPRHPARRTPSYDLRCLWKDPEFTWS
jgi:hypothetical protein